MNASTTREAALFALALEQPAAERAAFLQIVCGEDEALLRRLESLLVAQEQIDNKLDTDADVLGRHWEAPAYEGGPTMKQESADTPDDAVGQTIGRYKLLENIGEGGWGVVYVAEQTEPVRRRVALKVIKLGMDTRAVVARFEAERQALAMMDHPNIARVLDAGATETGRPYFVMELVRGIRITDYCDQNSLPTKERLDLFIKVCQAIQHAHQKGIIHRDIKPSNILVTLHDGVPVPKVIDFGIAKATEGKLTEATVYTQLHQFIGTPAYMSPEQAEMSGLDVDTRSDIYSLGVLLYELLTGRTPFDAKELMSRGLDAMRKTMREREPVRPSTKLAMLGREELTTTARRRSAEGPKLINLLKGDLDWIAMKCLEKDRTRRYETANGLAMDLLRYVTHEPVLARPPSKLYRLGKSVRRNRTVFAAGAAVLLALVAGAVLSAWQAVRAGRAEISARQGQEVAIRAQRQAEEINRFLTEDLLYQATPEQNAREEKLTMEEAVRRAAHKLEQSSEIARQPELEATLRLAIGTTCFKLSLLGEAEKHLRRAVDLRRSALGPMHHDTLKAQAALCDFLNLGLRRFDEAEALALQTWKGYERLLGPDDRETLASLSHYAQILSDQRKLSQAERLIRQALDGCERVLGPDDFVTIDTLGNLGYVLADQGKYADAERCELEEIARYRRAGYADRDVAFYAVNNLAMYRVMQGHPEEAEPLSREASQRAARVLGAEHVATLHLQNVLVRILTELDRLGEAEALGKENLATRRRVLPAHEGTGRMMLFLGRVLVMKGDYEAAEPLLREARALFREHYSKKPELVAQAENWLGFILLSRHAYAEAESLMLPGAELLQAPGVPMSVKERRAVLSHLVQLYEEWGKPDQAGAWQKKLDGLTGPESTSITQKP